MAENIKQNSSTDNYVDTPFDPRLFVAVQYDNSDSPIIHIPFSGSFQSAISNVFMPVESLLNKKDALVGNKEKNIKGAGVSEEEFQELVSKQKSIISETKKNVNLLTQPSLINPYARVHLAGSVSSDAKNKLIDNITHRPWYEDDNTNSDTDYGYSKLPTTTRLIEWGKSNLEGKTPYQFQDFVFCKWWNKIPNNRLITLRRYAMPILDNLSTPGDDEGSNADKKVMFPPLATAVTYFGEDTGNSLKDILKFSTGLNWGDTSANVWDVQGDSVSSNTVMDGAGNALKMNALFSGMGHALNGLSILRNDFNSAGLEELNGLPPDPYENGPYENRIKGPVNRIDSVKRRDAGLKFEMSGLKIKFDYVARPIGGINSKAVLLDILSNFMLMGSASAVFFGGAHRFRVKGTRFPAFNYQAIRGLYGGDLIGGIEGLKNTFMGAIEGDYGGNNFLQMIADVGKGLWSDLMNILGNPFGYDPDGAQTEDGKKGAEGVKRAIMQRMHTGMQLPYLTGMRALLLGEPVGDWHLTIGNPMNPIAMIGNLICTNIEVEFDEEAGLGPDDFPLAFTITVSLDHGMPRDRDAIESMFNKGYGRIYELPSNFKSSADSETSVDDQSGKNNKKPNEIANPHVYYQTRTSTDGVIKELINTDNNSYSNMNRKINNDNINIDGFLSNQNSKLSSRIPYHAAAEWITKKGIN